jgi:transcriptional regulator with XRE-family HTH domain
MPERNGHSPDGEWRQMLLRARKRLGVSREALATLSGVSASAVRGYEIGRRHPKQDSLEAILDALKLDRTESNPIRESAGFAPVRSLYDHRAGYYFTVEELQTEVERVPWPEFVVNDTVEVVAANRMASAVWGLDFQAERKRRTPLQRNLLAVASEMDFPRVVENWDEILELLASVYKGSANMDSDLGEPSPYLAQVIGHFTTANPQFLQRLLEAWTRATPSPAKVRLTYRVIWNHRRHGRMIFHCVMGTASEHEGLTFNDWIPVNPATWTALHGLMLELGEDPRAWEQYLSRPRRVLEP